MADPVVAAAPPAAPSSADILFPKAAPAAPAPSAEAAPAGTVAPEPAAAEAPSGEAPVASAPTEPVTGAEAGSLATGTDADPSPALDAPPSAPLTLDSYTELKVPEGLTVDAGLLTKFKEASLDGALAPDKAQGLLDLYHTALQTAQSASKTAAEIEVARWTTETNALPEFTGATRRTSEVALGRAFDEYGSPELDTFLATTGVGNNPHLVKYILKLALALDEGRPAPSGTPANPGTSGRLNGARTPGDILFHSGGPGSAPIQQ